ncbi:lytic transglycosylase domain-containing protein [Mitsuaria sp. GD03876]|uniref:lytic transglycosylase domain-containing protein n=1 Tax=Mitsuaria sp. GD03876 TaxID=2975399 RepID=UPI002446A882|nr:lytic transglycosylase domain-containing protein [Mitsuaria sp. GD03876]MDH0865922.1 lytic transglycosylase domain-containing protein [Mitsuaria sp. GD03876]
MSHGRGSTPRGVPLRRRVALGIAVAFAAKLTPAHAELWGYVDADGIAHFAPMRVDGRFQPVMSPLAGVQRVPGKTDHGQRMLTWLDIAPEVKAVQPYLREAAAATGVDAELLKAIIAVESGFKSDAVSPRGATGLMQITPVTAQRYATADELRRPALLLEPRANVLIGARMLADLTRRFGRIDAALAAWNAGEGAVRRAGGHMPDIDETQAHVHLVLELYWALLQRSLGARARQLTMVEMPGG